MRSLKLLLGILMALLCVTPAAAQEKEPYVSPAECPIDVPANLDIECGQLSVPENYEKLEGRWITMPYLIIHSATADPEATPLIFTEGGPGGDSLRVVWWYEKTGVLEDRDVIVFQQRGNLFAAPALTCEMDEFYDDATGTSPCLEKFKKAGIDLTQYHTGVIARDIESLRVALEIDQWNFFGVSYSTRLGQVLLDRYPEGLRSVILQSVSPIFETRYQHDPEHSYRVLQVMFEDCAADKACAVAYPDLERRFYTLVKELNQKPIDLTLSDPSTGEDLPYQVTGHTLINWMVGQAFYSPAHPPYPAALFPLLIDNLTAGDQSYLATFAQNQLKNEIFRPDYIAFGLYLTVNCQDDAGSVTQFQIDTQKAAFPQMDGFFRHYDEWQLCQLWDLPAAPALAEVPVTSDVPVLVLAGRYDPITPPEWSQMVAENLENSFYVEFPSKGHSIDTGKDCGFQIKNSFLRDPWSEPDTSCLADEPSPTFLVPDDLVSNRGFLVSLEDIDFGIPERGRLGLEILTGASLAIFLIEVLVFLVLSGLLVFKPAERKRKAGSFGYLPHVFAVVIALLSIGIVFLISELNQQYVWTYDLLNHLGYFEFAPIVTILGLTVLAQMAFCVVLLLLVILAWGKKQSTLLNRILLSLVLAAGGIFWVFYIRWDLVQLLFL